MCSNSLNSQKNKEWAHDSHKLSRTPFLNDDTLHQILSKIHLRYICIYFGVRDVQAHLGKEPSKAQLERVEGQGGQGRWEWERGGTGAEQPTCSPVCYPTEGVTSPVPLEISWPVYSLPTMLSPSSSHSRPPYRVRFLPLLTWQSTLAMFLPADLLCLPVSPDPVDLIFRFVIWKHLTAMSTHL